MNANEVILWPQWTIKKAKRTGSPFFGKSCEWFVFRTYRTTKRICSSSIHNITNIAHKVLSILAYSTHTPYVWLKVMWLSSSWRLLWSVAFMHEIASSTKMFNTASKCYIFMILREMNKGFLKVYCIDRIIFLWKWVSTFLHHLVYVQICFTGNERQWYFFLFFVTSKIIRENKSSSNLIHSKNFVKTIDWQNKMISRNFAFCCYKF